MNVCRHVFELFRPMPAIWAIRVAACLASIFVPFDEVRLSAQDSSSAQNKAVPSPAAPSSAPQAPAEKAPEPNAARPVTNDQLARWLALPHERFRAEAWGVTRAGTPLVAWQTAEAFESQSVRRRILIVGGLDGNAGGIQAVRALTESPTVAETLVQQSSVIAWAIPCANPDGLTSGKSPQNGVGGIPRNAFPAVGPAYHSATEPEAAYLWRWTGMSAPDFVLEVAMDDESPVTGADFSPVTWQFGVTRETAMTSIYAGTLREGMLRLAASLAARPAPAGSFVHALANGRPCEMGSVPAARLVIDPRHPDWKRDLNAAFIRLVTELETSGVPRTSPARAEWQRRTARTPLQVATELADVYGHTLPQAEYIPAVAMIGRLRLSQYQRDEQVLPDLERIVAPFLDGRQDPTPKSGSGQSGHLIFAALADATEGERRAAYVQRVRKAADQMFTADGQMLEAMPFHSEMSDAAFMGGPILAAAGRLTGESRYFDAAVRQIRFVQRLDRRPDGLYRHSPLDESAWGRGNGFPALGLALVLSDLPADNPDRAELVAAHRAHLLVLQKHQDATGAWHQVIDRPESYRELTATCMITFAMRRGVQRGWLDSAEFQTSIDRGWQAALSRIGPDGRLVDVCTGTGKMKSLREYYDREALLGRDPRGGAMSLLLATEMLPAPPR